MLVKTDLPSVQQTKGFQRDAANGSDNLLTQLRRAMKTDLSTMTQLGQTRTGATRKKKDN